MCEERRKKEEREREKNSLCRESIFIFPSKLIPEFRRTINNGLSLPMIMWIGNIDDYIRRIRTKIFLRVAV